MFLVILNYVTEYLRTLEGLDIQEIRWRLAAIPFDGTNPKDEPVGSITDGSSNIVWHPNSGGFFYVHMVR